jgi:predicted neuraminidase
MGLYGRSRLRHVLVLVGAGTLLLADGHPSAQTTSPGGASGFPAAGSTGDEMAPRLVAGPRGEALRLWQRRADPRAGGGAVFLAIASAPAKWQTLVEIRSPEKGVTIRDPELAISASNELALIYRWWRNEPRAKQLRLARSDDAGQTWSQPATPIDTSGKAFDPNIAWGAARSLVAVWADERRGNRLFHIYARRSPDGGTTWEQEQLLSRFPELAPSDLFARPKLIGDGQGRLWAAWVGVKNGRSSLYMNRSVDGGRKWTDPAPLTGDSRSVFGHSLHRAGDRMLLVWQDTRTERDRVYAVSSSDAGATWTAPVRVDHLSADSAVNVNSPAALLSADGEALVAWQDARNGRDDIFLARSTDGGRTWTKEDQRMDMDEAGTAVSQYPKLARAKDGRVALAWDDDRAGLEDVYLRVRSAGDKPDWGPEIRVSTPAPKLAARLPRLLWAPDGLLHVAWEVWDHTLAPGSTSKRIAGKALRVDSR